MDFREINLHLLIPEGTFRNVLKDLLRDLGFLKVTMGQSHKNVLITLTDPEVDLVIMSADFPDGDVLELVSDMRHGKLGNNPFLPIIMVAFQPTQELVNDVTNCGVDDMVTYPVSPKDMLERITTLTNNRKKFVVTGDYIGPDRRKSEEKREGQVVVPLIDAPNPLEVKLKGTVSREEFEAQILDVKKAVKSQRIERGADSMAWLIHRVIAGYKWGEGNELEEEVELYLRNMEVGAQDLSIRMAASRLNHYCYLCEGLLKITGKLYKNRPKINKIDIQLLELLAQAFRGVFKSSQDVEFAKEIKSLIEKY